MAQSNERPETIQKLGHSLYGYNYDISETVKTTMGMEQKGFEFTQTLFDHAPTRYEAINAIIANKYPNGEENALQRKGILNPENAEFVAYCEFVENVKQFTKDDFIA